MLRYALSIVFGIAIVLASVISTSSMHVEDFASSGAQVVAMSEHAVPAGKKDQVHKAHTSCNPGMSCFAVPAPAEDASALTPLLAAMELADIARLVTRAVIPPLPPPKIIILA